ncbi:membrin-11-like isoform X2 [Tripterygium wilfordii]|uniref:membrin-11-like isoform X2 n=1 Tax=Tripterygium wilfordii TaxID=458696 RepID=UPI0018F7EE00|nr:membrin-11-like isoform X2 [Tripterygium wilfordii]
MAMTGVGGGGTLSDVYQSAKRQLLKARDGIEKLERTTSNGGLDSPEMLFAVKIDISQILSLCTDMDRLWRSIAAKPQRDLWKRKVEQVAEEVESLKYSLDRYVSRNQKRIREAQERAELFGRANGDSAHVLKIFDEEAQAMQSVRNSSRMLEESLWTGSAILSKYAEQRERLKMKTCVHLCMQFQHLVSICTLLIELKFETQPTQEQLKIAHSSNPTLCY